jgi:hypothetical protein
MLPLGEWFLTFQMIVVPSFSSKKQSKPFFLDCLTLKTGITIIQNSRQPNHSMTQHYISKDWAPQQHHYENLNLACNSNAKHSIMMSGEIHLYI